MRTKGYAVCSVALLLAFTTGARANLILADTYKATPEDTANIIAVASSKLGEPLNNLLRLDDLALAPSGSPITLSYFALDSGNGSNANNAANISWNLVGTGAELLAVYVFGGSNGANLYKVTDTAQQTTGSAVVHTPLTGSSGKFATISHILFLGTGAITNAVPDGGTTAGLLALALGGLALVRSRLR